MDAIHKHIIITSLDPGDKIQACFEAFAYIAIVWQRYPSKGKCCHFYALWEALPTAFTKQTKKAFIYIVKC